MNTTSKKTNAIRSHRVSQIVQLRDAENTFGLVDYKAIGRKQFDNALQVLKLLEFGRACYKNTVQVHKREIQVL